MKKLQHIILYATFTISIVALALHGKAKLEGNKTVYVRSHDLIYNYLGMKDAQDKLGEKRSVFESQLDSLKMDFQKSLNQYSSEVSQMTIDARKERESLLELQQNNIVQYAQSIEQKLETEEKRLLEGVLNQVNSFAAQYGEKHQLDFVFGTTLDGNLLFGKAENDITDELLTALNHSYHGS